MKISNIDAIEILDSRGNPTVKAYVELENGIIGSASVPSGASTGTHEVMELRDGDEKRYLGLGVQKAVENVKSVISKQLIHHDIENLEAIDKLLLELDTTETKSRLGANALLAVSLAACRTLSFYQKKPLWRTLNDHYFNKFKPSFPQLMVNVINGGKHANWNFDIQEFMLSPVDISPAVSVQIASEIFHILGKLLKTKGLSTLVGDEGGYSPHLGSNDDVIELIQEAIAKAGYSSGQVNIALDAAASEFFDDGIYRLSKNGGKTTRDDLISYYLHLQQKFGLIAIEDPFHEDDWEAFKKLNALIGEKTLIVGDDLYATNPKRIKRGIEEKSTNAVLIKVNQIGTVLETVQSIQLCKENNLSVIISHRSGETEDSFIADLAVSCAAEFIKTGSMSRSDRLAKYNRLLEIETREFKKMFHDS